MPHDNDSGALSRLTGRDNVRTELGSPSRHRVTNSFDPARRFASMPTRCKRSMPALAATTPGRFGRPSSYRRASETISGMRSRGQPPRGPEPTVAHIENRRIRQDRRSQIDQRDARRTHEPLHRRGHQNIDTVTRNVNRHNTCGLRQRQRATPRRARVRQQKSRRDRVVCRCKVRRAKCTPRPYQRRYGPPKRRPRRQRRP